MLFCLVLSPIGSLCYLYFKFFFLFPSLFEFNCPVYRSSILSSASSTLLLNPSNIFFPVQWYSSALWLLFHNFFSFFLSLLLKFSLCSFNLLLNLMSIFMTIFWNLYHYISYLHCVKFFVVVFSRVLFCCFVWNIFQCLQILPDFCVCFFVLDETDVSPSHKEMTSCSRLTSSFKLALTLGCFFLIGSSCW